MKFLYSAFTLLFLVGASLAAQEPADMPAADSPERTQDCCYPSPLGDCNDGTRGTPYCGRGPCNPFGCACEGGCR